MNSAKRTKNREKRNESRSFRRKEDKEIRQAKDEWEKTFDAIQDIITILDTDMRIVRANKAAYDLFGGAYGDLTGEKCYKVFHDLNEKCADCKVEGNNNEFKPYKGLIYNKKVNKTFDISSAPIFDDTGKVKLLVHTARDVTRQKQDEVEKNLLSEAIEQASEVIVITDETGSIQYVNPAFSEMTGYSRSEVTGKNPRILNSGEHDQMFYEEMWRTLLQGRVWSGRLVNRKKDGSLFREDVRISPVNDAEGNTTNFVAVKRDITKEELLENQLQQAMKMEAIGTLAGGIAHDFNNVLSAMIGYGQIAKGRLNPDDPAQEDIDQILQAGDRAVALVKQILTFSRQDEQEKFHSLHVQILVKEVLRLMRSSLPATIDLVYNVDKGCGSVLADSSQIHQVLVNLFTNAKQAIGGAYGRIEVNLSELVVVPDNVLENPLLKSGRYIDLEIRDSGCGMDSHTLERIFDPFFSTKAKEHGTGLGLAVVHGIVSNHGGEIAVQSEVGQGTTFHVYLPVSEQEAVEDDEVTEPLYKGSERIMVVDDEDVVGRVIRSMLSRMGYKVTLFTSSLEAVKSFRRNPHDYDLVFTDMTMPDMTGAELAREVLALRPELPVIMTTGYSEIIDKEKAERIGIKKFMLKPMKRKHLSRIVREVLDNG